MRIEIRDGLKRNVYIGARRDGRDTVDMGAARGEKPADEKKRKGAERTTEKEGNKREREGGKSYVSAYSRG